MVISAATGESIPPERSASTGALDPVGSPPPEWKESKKMMANSSRISHPTVISASSSRWEAFIASSGAYAEGYFAFSRHNGGEDRVGNGIESLFNRVDLHRGKDSGGETFESEHEFKFLFNQIDLCCGERLAFGEFEPDASSYGADFKIFDSVQSIAHIADELLLEYAAVVAFDSDFMISAYN